MKHRITPIDRERVMREEDFIVSKTDAKGRITYANRIFMEFAGYSEPELLGGQHNIVRHPDMPRSVFKFMWETLQAGQEFFGYVKNMASDGSFYWVFANVTPTRNERGETVGYYSVRRKPRLDAVAAIAPVYAQMLAKEQQAGPKQAIAASRGILEHGFQSRGVTYEEFVLAL
ncbi:MAG: PAS domain-containing protein [Chromatiaceae bacterium]|nr:PAS domain-containing protein [Chromatiaceae bacterium]